MALHAGISQVFLALGPLVGGFLTEYVSWRAVFLLDVPVGVVPPGAGRGRASAGGSVLISRAASP